MTDDRPPELDDSDAILAALIEERQLAGKVTVSQLALLRQVSKLLADPSASSAGSVAPLLAMLPPVVQRREREPSLEELDASPADLTRLDDAELDELERLLSIAKGLSEPIPNRRLELALELVALLDASGTSAEVNALPPAQFEEFRIKVNGAITSMLYPTVAMTTLHPELSFGDLTSEVVELRERLAEAEQRLARSGPTVVDLARKRAEAVGF